jgi:hypothetical protein
MLEKISRSLEQRGASGPNPSKSPDENSIETNHNTEKTPKLSIRPSMNELRAELERISSELRDELDPPSQS